MSIKVDTEWYYKLVQDTIDQWEEVLSIMVQDHSVPVPAYNSATIRNEDGIIHVEWDFERTSGKQPLNCVAVELNISYHDYWGKIWVVGSADDLESDWSRTYKPERYPHGILSPQKLSKELAEFVNSAIARSKEIVTGPRTLDSLRSPSERDKDAS